MAERKFKEVEQADFIILGGERENGPVIKTVEGQLLEKSEMNMRGGLVGRYQFEREDGTPFTLLGAKLLDEKLMQVEVGNYVRISLLDETVRTSTGNQMKTFKVEIAE